MRILHFKWTMIFIWYVWRGCQIVIVIEFIVTGAWESIKNNIFYDNIVKIVQSHHLISCHNWYQFGGTLGQALDKCQCHPYSIVFCTRIDFLIWFMIRVLVLKLNHFVWRKSIVIYVGLMINPCVYGLEMMKFISVWICCSIYVLMKRKERKKNKENEINQLCLTTWYEEWFSGTKSSNSFLELKRINRCKSKAYFRFSFIREKVYVCSTAHYALG